MWRSVLIWAALAVAVVNSQDRNMIIQDQVGYKMDRAPTYMVIAPNKIRPGEVVQIYATILKLEYQYIDLHISVVQGTTSYSEISMKFERPGSRLLQMKMPSNSLTGQYKLRVEGKAGDAGNVFYNETDILFTPKQASLFIQLSKPIYRQGQNVSFRVVPFQPNMMPKYGSMTIYVKDPTGFPVRRWLALQTNAGGLVSQSFMLSDQPNYGNWTIQVDAFGYTYNKSFLVEEYWDPRFDVNVTVKPYVMDSVKTVGGYINANMTTGKPIEGNATVVLTVKPPLPDNYDPNSPLAQNWLKFQKTVQVAKTYSYLNGPIQFEFGMDDIRTRIRTEINALVTSLEGYEFHFNVSVYDWFFRMTREGYASTIMVSSKKKLQWVGDKVRSFKPDSVMTVQVALMNFDGTPVSTSMRIVLNAVYRYQSSGGQGGTSNRINNVPVMYKAPSSGIAEFQIGIDTQLQSLQLTARWEGDSSIQPVQLMAYRFYSPSGSYITLSTSTKNPKVNTYMIFHVKTSIYVPRISYQVIGGGNIIVGEELEMLSRRKTFAIALSREMVPTARVIVYYVSGQPEEIVVDSLTFFVDGTNLNKVSAVVNRGKDFTRDTIEIKAYADPGAYVAFAALPLDLYRRGLNDGLNEWNLIDELNTYDRPARGPWQHLWRLSETEFKYKFYTASGHGIDTSTTFRDAGLVVLSDVTVDAVPMTDICKSDPEMRPCFDQQNCYKVNKTCDNIFDCPNDWADEQNCPLPDPRYDNSTQNMISRVSRVLRFYEDSAWAWHETFTKPDGEVDFRVKVPKYPLTWVIHGISVSRNIGLGIQPTPIQYDATRYMYIIVESPSHIIRGEQVGVRVTVFNYWYGDEFIEVLVTMKGSDQYKSVLVGKEGYVTAYNPVTHSGDHQTIVFLEPGQSKDIFMPLVPNMVTGNFTFTVTAWCFLERDEVSKTVFVTSDGVENYYHTPYLVDMITFGSLQMPDLKVNVSDVFITPEQRFHNYIPGSPRARVTFFGDVVTPGFFVEYPTAEDIMYRPYGAGEMNMFNFAYNLITLLFKKANKQLSYQVTRRSLEYMNIALQRQFSYMNSDGSFRMFRDDPTPSMWLTAFVAKTLQEAKVGEWEKDLFIPVELLNKIVSWICENQHNETGEFNEFPNSPVYDRNYGSIYEAKQNDTLRSHPIPMTAYVLIALYKIKDVSGEAQSCLGKAKQRASEYLSTKIDDIVRSGEIFHLAITAYSLSLSQQRSITVFQKLWDQRKFEGETYFADEPIRPNDHSFESNVLYLLPRLPLINDAYGVQSTSYALLAHINHFGSQMGVRKRERDSMMKWLQTMRNYFGAFASSQDSLVAMEALWQFTLKDPNRNVFQMHTTIESSAAPSWRQQMMLTKDNYTHMVDTWLPKVFGQVRPSARGTGRALIQLTTTVNVEYPWQIRNPVDSQLFYLLENHNINSYGRNFSVIQMTPCVSWVYDQKSKQSGLSVLEISIPSGYVIMNDTLRALVHSKNPPNLKRAEFYNRKVVFYFDYLDQRRTCVPLEAHRWYPVANMTLQHRMRVYDYYEPGMHNTTMYTTHNLFSLNICYVCGSYQCPYCPFFNVATILKASFTTITLIVGFIMKRYMLWTT